MYFQNILYLLISSYSLAESVSSSSSGSHSPAFPRSSLSSLLSTNSLKADSIEANATSSRPKTARSRALSNPFIHLGNNSFPILNASATFNITSPKNGSAHSFLPLNRVTSFANATTLSSNISSSLATSPGSLTGNASIHRIPPVHIIPANTSSPIDYGTASGNRSTRNIGSTSHGSRSNVTLSPNISSSATGRGPDLGNITNPSVLPTSHGTKQNLTLPTSRLSSPTVSTRSNTSSSAGIRHTTIFSTLPDGQIKSAVFEATEYSSYANITTTKTVHVAYPGFPLPVEIVVGPGGIGWAVPPGGDVADLPLPIVAPPSVDGGGSSGYDPGSDSDPPSDNDPDDEPPVEAPPSSSRRAVPSSSKGSRKPSISSITSPTGKPSAPTNSTSSEEGKKQQSSSILTPAPYPLPLVSIPPAWPYSVRSRSSFSLKPLCVRYEAAGWFDPSNDDMEGIGDDGSVPIVSNSPAQNVHGVGKPPAHNVPEQNAAGRVFQKRLVTILSVLGQGQLECVLKQAVRASPGAGAPAFVPASVSQPPYPDPSVIASFENAALAATAMPTGAEGDIYRTAKWWYIARQDCGQLPSYILVDSPSLSTAGTNGQPVGLGPIVNNPSVPFVNVDHVWEVKFLPEFLGSQLNSSSFDCTDLDNLFGQLTGSGITRLQAIFNQLPGTQYPDLMGVLASTSAAKGCLFSLGGLENMKQNLSLQDPSVALSSIQDIAIVFSLFRDPDIAQLFQNTNSRIYDAFLGVDQIIESLCLSRTSNGAPLLATWAANFESYMSSRIIQAQNDGYSFVTSVAMSLSTRLSKELATNSPRRKRDSQSLAVLETLELFMDSFFFDREHYQFVLGLTYSGLTPLALARRDDMGSCHSRPPLLPPPPPPPPPPPLIPPAFPPPVYSQLFPCFPLDESYWTAPCLRGDSTGVISFSEAPGGTSGLGSTLDVYVDCEDGSYGVGLYSIPPHGTFPNPAVVEPPVLARNITSYSFEVADPVSCWVVYWADL